MPAIELGRRLRDRHEQYHASREASAEGFAACEPCAHARPGIVARPVHCPAGGA